MKVRQVDYISQDNRIFEVGSSSTARVPYQVRICSQPSCTCPDYNKNGDRVLCKHILFVLLFVLEVTDIDALESLHYTNEQVLDFLSKTEVDSQFFQAKKNTDSKRQRIDFVTILNEHGEFNSLQTLTHHIKTVRSAKCSGMNCKTLLEKDSRCVKVEGALGVPFGKDFATKQTFYFCP